MHVVVIMVIVVMADREKYTADDESPSSFTTACFASPTLHMCGNQFTCFMAVHHH